MSNRPSRLQAINGRLGARIETLPLSPLAASVLMHLAVQTSETGVCWYRLDRLYQRTKRPIRPVREAIIEASEHDALLWYVEPVRGRAMPWEGNGEAPFDAWKFFLPNAATSRRSVAEAVRWHSGAGRGEFLILGTGVEKFLHDFGAENDDHEESPPLEAAV